MLIVLNGSGGELDRQTIKIRDDIPGDEVSDQIKEAIWAWQLSPGDTIVITEVEGE